MSGSYCCCNKLPHTSGLNSAKFISLQFCRSDARDGFQLVEILASPGLIAVESLEEMPFPCFFLEPPPSSKPADSAFQCLPCDSFAVSHVFWLSLLPHVRVLVITLVSHGDSCRNFFFFNLSIYFERDRDSGIREGAEKEGKRQSQAGSTSQAQSPTWGLNPLNPEIIT